MVSKCLLRSASKIGASTSFATVCTTLSRIPRSSRGTGIPRGRSSPHGFGIITRRTGWHRYVFARQFIRVAQDVRAPDFVVEHPEPKPRLGVRPDIEFPQRSPDRV